MSFKTTVREWFKTGSKPTQTQFWSFFDSIRWNDEKIAITDITDIESILNAKAEKEPFDTHLTDANAHATEFGAKEDKNKKGAANGYAPLDEFIKLATSYLNAVNDLTTGGTDAVLTAEQGKVLHNYIVAINTTLDTYLVNDLTTGGITKALTAEQGKVLQTQISGINLLLASDDINLDTLQEIVTAIKSVDTYLSTILVNDLITGGTTKALTAEMGVTLQTQINNILIDKADDQRVTNLFSILNIVPVGKLSVYKVLPNNDGTQLEVGDTVIGYVEGQFLNGVDYMGGDVTLLASYGI